MNVLGSKNGNRILLIQGLSGQSGQNLTAISDRKKDRKFYSNDISIITWS